LLLLLTFTGISVSTFAQEETTIQIQTEDPETWNDSNEVFVFVEEAPCFPGGDKARIKFLIKNISYPKAAKENGIQGTVYISFVIEKDGRVSNAKVLRGIGGGCDEEALRVINKMPKWKPGVQRGKTVRAQFNMPIRFTLANDSKTVTKSKKELRKERRLAKKNKL
jgi:TonB family protein